MPLLQLIREQINDFCDYFKNTDYSVSIFQDSFEKSPNCVTDTREDLLSSERSSYKKMPKIEAYLVTVTLKLQSVKTEMKTKRPNHTLALTHSMQV